MIDLRCGSIALEWGLGVGPCLLLQTMIQRGHLALLLGLSVFLGGCSHESSKWRVGTRLYKNNTYYGTITAINTESLTVETRGVKLPGFSDEPIIVQDEPSHLASLGVRAK